MSSRHVTVPWLYTHRGRDLANRKLRKAVGDHHRLTSLMKARHPVGIVGVDSTANTESQVYGQVRPGQACRQGKGRV